MKLKLNQRCRIVRIPSCMYNNMECVIVGFNSCWNHPTRVQVHVDGVEYNSTFTCIPEENLEPIVKDDDGRKLVTWEEIPGGHPEQYVPKKNRDKTREPLFT
jgi:hypothetical protein